MNDKAEKVYGEAFFELCTEQNEGGLKDTLDELEGLNKVFEDAPEFAKMMGTPTVSVDEKLSLCRDIIKAGGVSELVGNLLCLLSEKNRINCFAGIVKVFKERYNEKFKLAEITVTTSEPLTDKMKEQIAERMSKIIGKTVTLNEKVERGIIGGIIIDYGSKRYDGSVKARLNALKDELGSVIA
ncbi:MAG: ATP synthase F1 subunit delta [Lachnospiraceae bacterium]|nr:ATP synthase F1 subunit delta [Ruminococcus sp.]MCM1274915.1 ATP synthase F1 subunit delta [Lachnospiraceae bacterium]